MSEMDARPCPRVQGKLPFNIDILGFVVKSFLTGYPGRFGLSKPSTYQGLINLVGEGFTELQKTMGHVYDLNVLGRTSIFTTCPEHIQIVLATDFHNYVKGMSPR
jgi:hypothetical protein